MAKKNLKFVSALFILLFLATGCAVNKSGGKATEKSDNTNAQKTENQQTVVGGDKDEYGCIGSAGYSWCELKNKCLRIWEEPCLPDEEVRAVKDYLSKNISTLSPEKEVLGGKFYITNTRFNKSGEIVADYEDGHIALQGTATYEYKNGEVKILTFIMNDDTGENGTGNKSEEDKITIIKHLFADKYKKSIDDIKVTIDKEDESHIRGSVNFGAEGGIYLAAKINDEWKIIHDGNGMIDCKLKTEYGFSDDMTKDCADSRTENKSGSGVAGIANPASAFCQEKGGQSEIVTAADGSQSGVCKFDDGSSCDEWQYFRGECQPGG